MSIVYGHGVPSYGRVDREYAQRLATCPPGDDGPVYMLNLMKYRAVADYGNDGPTDVRGVDADDAYAPVDVLADIGAEIVLTADVLASTEDWDRVAVVKYATRRSFIEMQTRKDFQAKHVHKEAGMDHTTVLGTLPVDGLPPRAKPASLTLHVWRGSAPDTTHGAVAFAVEGTIIGDGRSWDGAAFATGEAATTTGSPDHQILVLRPNIDRWQ
jgi:hypothetical protein